MADLDSYCELSNGKVTRNSRSLCIPQVLTLESGFRFVDVVDMEQSSDPVALGFSLASPDLVNCGVSPDIPRGSYVDSPEIAKKLRFSTELSLENGIDGRKTRSVKFSAINQTFEFELSPESSFELPSLPGNATTPVMSVNSGSINEDVTVADVTFLKDEFFSGGGTVMTDDVVGSEEEALLYQTARVGDFAYTFKALDPGDYFIDLHFAEIEFTEGPAGVRVFDIFIQGAKARLELFFVCFYYSSHIYRL